MKFSFVVCTYNPPFDRLERVVAAAAEAAAGTEYPSEVLVIDNRSEPPIGEAEFLKIAPGLRVAREYNPGLTSARIRGWKESNGETIIYVDDDNILDPDYACELSSLVERLPEVGVFSAGKILPEYEVEPPEEIRFYWPYMALIDADKEKWGKASVGVLPMGAGMAVRREVMAKYAEEVERSPARAGTDRDGKSLAAGGDTDIGMEAMSMGLGCGVFPQLKLRHVMPAERLHIEYLRKLVKEVSYSCVTVSCHWNPPDWKVWMKTGIRAFFTVLCRRGRRNYPTRRAAISRWQAVSAHLKTFGSAGRMSTD